MRSLRRSATAKRRRRSVAPARWLASRRSATAFSRRRSRRCCRAVPDAGGWTVRAPSRRSLWRESRRLASGAATRRVAPAPGRLLRPQGRDCRTARPLARLGDLPAPVPGAGGLVAGGLLGGGIEAPFAAGGPGETLLDL